MSNARENATPIRRSLLRRSLAWGLGLSLVLVTAAATLLLALDLGWQRDRLVAFASGIVANSFDMEVSIEDISGRLSEGVVLSGGRLGDPRSPILIFDRLSIDWELRSLFVGRRQKIESVVLEGWSLRLERDEHGDWSQLQPLLDRLSAPAEENEVSAPAAPSILVERMELEPGEVAVALASSPKGESPDPPRTARFRIAGRVREFRVDAIDPPSLTHAELHGELIAIESGRPEFDRDASLTLDVQAADRRIDALTARFRARGTALDLRATGTAEEIERLQAEFEIEDLSVFEGWWTQATRLAGSVAGRVSATGPPDALIGDLEVSGEQLHVDSVRAREIDLDIELESAFAGFDPADWRTMDARIDFRGSDLDAGLLRPDWFPPGGAALQLEGELREGTLVLSRAEVDTAALRATAEGRLDQDVIERLDLRFQVPDISPWLESIAPEAALRGALRGEARLSGPVRQPYGSARVESTKLFWGPTEPVSLRSEITRDADGPARVVAEIVHDDASLLALKATVDPDRERVDYAVGGDAGGLYALLQPAEPASAERSPFESSWTAEGFFARQRDALSFDASIRGEETRVGNQSLGVIEFAARSVAPRRAEVRTLSSRGGPIAFELREPAPIQWTPRGRWNLKGATVRLSPTPDEKQSEPDRSGQIELQASGEGLAATSLDVSLAQLPMYLVHRVLEDTPRFDGVLSGNASWQRERETGWTRGTLDWTRAGVGGTQLDRVKATWDSDPNTIRAEIESNLGGRRPVGMTAALSVPPAPAPVAEVFSLSRIELDARLDRLDLSLFESASPSWMRRVAGEITGELRVQPGASGPRMSGTLEIAGGGLSIPLLRNRLAPIDGTLRFDERTLAIDGLRIGKPGAHARLRARLDARSKESPKLEGEMLFTQFPLARSSAASMDVQGRIDLRGTWARPVIEGDLEIANARLGVPAADDPILKEIRFATRDADGALVERNEADPIDPIAADVRFTIPESTRLRGQGANLYVGGRARLRKDAGERLRMTGEARVVNGTYVFQGRNFNVRRGRVTLTGDARLDPVLDVEARHPVADIVAIVELSGRLSAPIVRLTSDPPRSDQDVLAYLLFGRPASSVTAAGDSRFGAAAARLVAGVAERELREVLGDAMPVDSIEIGADAEGNTNELGFGKYLSPNLFFRYVRVLGDEPTDRVGVEYRVNDSLSIGSSVSTAGDAGLDLIFRSDF